MMRVSPRLSRLAAAGLLIATLVGCAHPPPADDPDAIAEFKETNDPLEPTNRVFYAVNNGIDTVLLRPLAVAYRWAVPEVVRTHTHNVLANLSMPVVLTNDILQARPRRAGDSLMRFLVNSTVGVVGVFDVATDLGWPAHDSDGGLTLAMWGLSDGPFLFLPVLGPSGPRDATGFGTDLAVDPLTWVGAGALVTAGSYTRFGLNAVDARAAVLDDLDKIKAQALDPYATLRSLYRQRRQSQVDDIRSDNRATVPAWFRQSAAP
jgi:phospholipid-binding lipoprotein MlaA